MRADDRPGEGSATDGPSLAGGLVAVSLIGLNLRTAVVAVPPLLEAIQHSLGFSSAVAGLLTTVPTLCFGLFAAVAPALGRRIGTEPALAAGLALLVAGSALRLAPGVFMLFTGTLLTGIGAALGNVLLPALVKRDFPRRVGLLTGSYTMALTAGSAIAAGVAVPLDHALSGWRPALAVWAVPAAVALAATLALRRRRGGPSPAAVSRVPLGHLSRQPLAWMLTAFMGTQSLVYYSTLTWMPTVFEQHGASAARAGLYLSVSSLFSIPTALLAPLIAGRLPNQSPLVVGAVLVDATGLLGLILAPAAQPLLWSCLIGIGTGIPFATALTMIGLRSPDARVAASLSSMMQGYGYLFTAGGPFVVGLLHDVVGGWTVPLALLLVILVPQTMAGLASARPRILEAVSPPQAR
ncbi:MAG TPA: MFS transporter [Acidimicrobiales bacterium]|nr:MFS transporter [Acidimicrobiales bacterium]